jgi:hypothetical protein
LSRTQVPHLDLYSSKQSKSSSVKSRTSLMSRTPISALKRLTTLNASLAFNDSPSSCSNFAFTQVVRASSGRNKSELRDQHSRAALSMPLSFLLVILGSDEGSLDHENGRGRARHQRYLHSLIIAFHPDKVYCALMPQVCRPLRSDALGLYEQIEGPPVVFVGFVISLLYVTKVAERLDNLRDSAKKRKLS